MTDETEQPEPEATAPGDVGAWLRAGRKAKGLTVEAVASALHLDAPIVEALEREDFAAIGATVFVKGHLRAVAQHLDLDIEDAAQRFHATAGAAAEQPPELIVSYNKPALRQSDNRIVLIWGAAALIFLVIVLLAWILWSGPATSEPEATDTPAITPEPATNETQPAADMPVAGASTSAPEVAGDSTDFETMLANARTNTMPTETRSSSPIAAMAASPTAPVERGLRMSFTAECWYEVRDANGDQLAMGTARPGTSRLVTGARPLSVTLGVADAVTLEVDGTPLAISRADRRGRAARLVVR